MEAQVTKLDVRNTKPAAQPAGIRPSKLRRFLKYAVIGTILLTSLIFFANWVWTVSGSNQWELKSDKDGTQVYTLKTPGSSVLKVKGVMHTKDVTLSNHLAPFFDESIQNDCGKWVAGCQSYKILQKWDPKTERNVTMWTVALFPPFSPREFLLQGHVSQDPVSKMVTLENIAVPNKIAPNDCCVRLSHLHNVWHYTPVGEGKVKVELLYDIEMGGAFPQLLLNLGAPSEIHKMLTVDNPKLLSQEKYRQAKLDFIDDSRTK